MDVECAVVDGHVGVESTSDATSSREESSPLFLRVSSSYLLVAGRILHLVLNDSVDLVEALEGLDFDDEMESLHVDLLGIIEALEFHKKTDAALFVFQWVTCRFRASLKHKDDGQTKFIKPNSQRQYIIIKYWVSIGQSTQSRVDFKSRVDLVKFRFKRSLK